MGIKLRVKAIAESKGIENAAQLSRRADIAYATATRLFEGDYAERDRGIGHLTLKKVADALGVKVKDLLDEDR